MIPNKVLGRNGFCFGGITLDDKSMRVPLVKLIYPIVSCCLGKHVPTNCFHINPMIGCIAAALLLSQTNTLALGETVFSSFLLSGPKAISEVAAAAPKRCPKKLVLHVTLRRPLM